MKTIPFDREFLENITSEYPTPYHIYDEKAIRDNARSMIKAFDWVPGGFKNYFAVKALPNPYIIKILKEEGMGTDCSSLPELMLSEKAGLNGEDIMFTSNDTPAHEYQYARKAGAVINLDDISHIDYLEEHTGLPELLSFRYNPGPLKGGNDIIGKPEDAKYGFTLPQLIEGYRKIVDKGVKRFGLHTMVASNELNPDYFIETAAILFKAAAEVAQKTGISFEFINLGGGIGIPYKPDQKAIDFKYVSEGIQKAYNQILVPAGLNNVRIVMECGRVITGPYGYLVSRVLHRKDTYKKYVGLDASMANLMRPGMYGAYHHITVPGKEDKQTEVVDITGSLCENNDKFAIDREVPVLETGDFVVIHDSGAHGHSMGFNYNGKLRSAELLLQPNQSVKLIRRKETVEDYFRTLDFSDL